MKIRRKFQLTYIFTDFINLNIGWLLFNIARFYTLPASLVSYSLGSFLLYKQVIIGQIVVAPSMMLIYALSGVYNSSGTLYRSRLDEILNTLAVSLIGMVSIFFAVLVDDNIPERITSYELMAILLFALFTPTAIGRYIVSTAIARMVRRGLYAVDTVVVGSVDTLRRKIPRIRYSSGKSGLLPVACVIVDDEDAPAIDGLPVYGISSLEDVCTRYHAGAVIVLPDGDYMGRTSALLRRFYALGCPIFFSAETFAPSAMMPQVANVAGEPLVDITRANVPPMIANIKRVADVVLSALSLVLLSPVMCSLAIFVACGSKGPILYRQQRIGYRGKEFNIIKFRSMYVDAEADGVPRLSAGNSDPRITPQGRFMRKYRLDELPQFWNVLIGEMSLVGPRPERRYYVDKIMERVPWYGLIAQVRPGITSWAVIKCGYASSVDEMVERSAYDLLYIRNISTALDLKILFYTIVVIVSGKGI